MAVAQRHHWMAWSLVIVWLLFTATAFWWFQFRDIQRYPTADGGAQMRLVESSPQMVALLRQFHHAGEVTVFHLWSPECQCSRFNNPHVAQLVQAYGSRGVTFVALAREGGTGEGLSMMVHSLFGPEVMFAHAEIAGLSASPAAVVVDGDGRVVYAGPYSSGAMCGTSGGMFVEKVLDSLLAGKSPPWSGVAAVGCFCNWNRGSWGDD